LMCQKALLCFQGCRGVQSLVWHKALLCLQGCRGVQCWVGHRALPRLQCHTGYTAVCATRCSPSPSPLALPFPFPPPPSPPPPPAPPPPTPTALKAQERSERASMPWRWAVGGGRHQGVEEETAEGGVANRGTGATEQGQCFARRISKIVVRKCLRGRRAPLTPPNFNVEKQAPR